MSDVQGTLKQFIRPAAPTFRQPWQQAGPEGAVREPLRRHKTVRERHKIVVFLACAGWTNIQIAKAMGYSPACVSIILRSQNPELLQIRSQAQDWVANHTTDVLLRFRQESLKSVETLVDVRDNADDWSQKRLAARDILDRAGYSVVHKQVNFNAEVPVAKLEETLGQLDKANEVEARRSEWAISNPGQK